MAEVTQELIHKLFTYKQETGQLIWKVNRGRARKGDTAGRLNENGYLICGLHGKTMRIHRLIWLYYFGYIPRYLDHINRDRADNRIENLRPATKAQNGANRKKQSGTTSKYKGVCRIRYAWQANAFVNGKSIYLGSYRTEEEAHKAYVEYMSDVFGEYFHA